MFSNSLRSPLHSLPQRSLLGSFRPHVSPVRPISFNLFKRDGSKPKPSWKSRFTINWSKYKLKNDPPGLIVGTINEPYKAPPPDYWHGSYHWTYERMVAVPMVPLFITPFVMDVDLPLLDSLLGTLLLVHCHAGWQSCIIDYIPKRRFGPWHTLSMRTLFLGTCVAFYGLYELETNTPGMFEISRSLWKALGKNDDGWVN
ncbi:hypothetical protein DASC09_037090 [Saccharomycopsis crataegensis]|uniref:Succinate dehydrogenase [ubiquinone] cytochrome b small subunit n=1 Tax=Saccharomycopsis crataegensis TaxID=43959 RepID=A0AAV5QNR2_9ASCO|nr:hypothetical protein DASC09_037090 [Saccharomycopsis crataegensis]